MRTLPILTLALTLGCSGKTENAVTSPGADGAEGAEGEAGPPGEDGEDGAPGEDGLDCWDLNGDGEANPEEDINGDGVVDVEDCRGDGAGGDDTGSATTGGVYLGDLTLRFEDEMILFCEHYDTVFGWLLINLQDATDLSSLSCLTEVSQSLYITGSRDLYSAKLPNLIRVGENFEVRDLYIAEEVEFASLETVGGGLIATTIGIEAPSATFEAPMLSSVGGIFKIELVGATELDLSALESVGNFYVTQNSRLLNLDGLPSLQLISRETEGGGELNIQNNASLEDISGMASLTHIQSNVNITSNPLLSTSEAESFVDSIDHVGGVVTILDNGPD